MIRLKYSNIIFLLLVSISFVVVLGETANEEVVKFKVAIPLNSDTFHKSVMKSKEAWIIIFHKGQIDPMWINTLLKLKGTVWIGDVNADQQPEIIESLGLGDISEPKLAVFKYGLQKNNKNRIEKKWILVDSTEKAEKVAIKSLENKVTAVKDFDSNFFHILNKCFSSDPPRFLAFIFTDGSPMPIFFKSLALRFDKYFQFVILKKPTKRELEIISIDTAKIKLTYPTFAIMIVNANIKTGKSDTAVVLYEPEVFGPLTYPNVMKFLFQVNLKHRSEMATVDLDESATIAEDEVRDTELYMLDVSEIEKTRFDISFPQPGVWNKGGDAEKTKKDNGSHMKQKKGKDKGSRKKDKQIGNGEKKKVPVDETENEEEWEDITDQIETIQMDKSINLDGQLEDTFQNIREMDKIKVGKISKTAKAKANQGKAKEPEPVLYISKEDYENNINVGQLKTDEDSKKAARQVKEKIDSILKEDKKGKSSEAPLEEPDYKMEIAKENETKDKKEKKNIKGKDDKKMVNKKKSKVKKEENKKKNNKKGGKKPKKDDNPINYINVGDLKNPDASKHAAQMVKNAINAAMRQGNDDDDDDEDDDDDDDDDDYKLKKKPESKKKAQNKKLKKKKLKDEL